MTFHCTVWLAAASIASAAALLLRGGDDGAVESSHQNHISSIWPFHHDTSDIKNGITFERTETLCPLLHTPLPEEVNIWTLLQFLSSLSFLPKRFQIGIQSSPPQISPRATFDNGHCESSDVYGGNSCHYDWDDDITINYDGRLGQELGEDVYLEMSVKVSLLFDWFPNPTAPPDIRYRCRIQCN